MIYIDSSILLATILAEDRAPSDDFWQADSISSRLLHYEVMNRLNAYSATPEQITDAENLIASLTLVELSPTVLKRALDPWPIQVRTLDALHLATALYLTGQSARLTLATYDRRMAQAASRLGLDVVEPT